MIAFFRSLPKIHDHKWKFFAFFRAKLGGLQKKKGLRQNSEWFFGRNPKFKGFFRPKLGGLQNKNKKKSLRQNLDWYFVQIRKFRRFRGGCFRMGGLFSIFHRKSASKAQKTCDFAYFTSHTSQARAPPPPPPPPPGYATGPLALWGFSQHLPAKYRWRPCYCAGHLALCHKSGSGYCIMFMKKVRWGPDVATFRTKNLNFTQVIHVNWLSKLNWGGPGLLVVNLLLIAVVHVYCCTLRCQKKLKNIDFFVAFLSLVLFQLEGGPAPRVPLGYAYV